LLTPEEEILLGQAIENGLKARNALATEELPPRRRRELLAQIEEGDLARAKFIESNLRLVVALARQYSGDRVDLLDLIQEGNLGLMTAVDRFDWKKGFKFSTYASWWIRESMQRSRGKLADPVKIPVRLNDMRYSVLVATERLMAQLGRAPSVEEIAESTGHEPEAVSRVLSIVPTVTLDSPIGETHADLGELIVDERTPDPADIVEFETAERLVRQGLASLTEVQRRVVELRFGFVGEARSLAAISEATGIPVHRVSRHLSDALTSLERELSWARDPAA
jgi:RNA polymerase primary sigma factor